MLFETVTLYDNKQFTFLNMGYDKGRVYLKQLGYTHTSSTTMQAMGSKARYNGIVGYWIIDNA